MPLLSAVHHDQAQVLRSRYAAQLLALEQNLPPGEWTSDVGIVAARLVAAVYELHPGDGAYDATWLARFFSPSLVAARLGNGDAIPPFDDLLAFLGIGIAALGAPLGIALQPSASPVDDVDAALAVL